MESIGTQDSPGARESTGARWLGVGAVLAAIKTLDYEDELRCEEGEET